jgi:hypothetical protein
MKQLVFHQIVIIKNSPDETINNKIGILLGADGSSDDSNCFVFMKHGNKETITIGKRFLKGTASIVNSIHDIY